MGEKKMRAFLTVEELRAEVIDWSWDTIKRRIKDDNFPYTKIAGRYYFDRAKVLEYLTKRGEQD